MFDNIGKKIKGLAVALFTIEAIGAFIAGIVFITDSDDENAVVGLLVMVGGILISWISSWFLYGFGEIIDKLQDIERNTRGTDRKADQATTAPAGATNQTNSQRPHSENKSKFIYYTIPCPHCRRQNKTNRTTCWNCGGNLPLIDSSAEESDAKEVTSVEDSSAKCKCGALFTGNFCPNCGCEKDSAI